MHVTALPAALRLRGSPGFTLAEVVISLGISITVIAAVMCAYILTSKAAAKSACSAAANAALVRQMEQVRSARWDIRASPAIDELVAFNATTNVVNLNIPISNSAGSVYTATNYTTVQLIRATPPLRSIRIDCAWMVPSASTTVYTNSLVSFRGPDL
jgi:type II secretory pathway pseudopilin PulG